MPAAPSLSRYVYAGLVGVITALVADFVLVPPGWRVLMGLALCFSLGFAGVFFAAMTDPRLRR